MTPSRRAPLAVAVAVVALGALVAIGRWERNRHADEELRELAAIRALVGPLDNPTLSAYRVGVGTGFDCLLYRRGTNRFALEVCVDRAGRLVEAIDRRGRGDPRIASLREDPELSTIRVDRGLVERLLRRLGAFDES